VQSFRPAWGNLAERGPAKRTWQEGIPTYLAHPGTFARELAASGATFAPRVGHWTPNHPFRRENYNHEPHS